MAFTAHCNALGVFYHFLLDSTFLCSARLGSALFVWCFSFLFAVVATVVVVVVAISVVFFFLRSLSLSLSVCKRTFFRIWCKYTPLSSSYALVACLFAA